MQRPGEDEANANNVTVVNVNMEDPQKSSLNTTIEHCCAAVKIDLNIAHGKKSTATGIAPNNKIEEISPVTTAIVKKAPPVSCCRRYLGIGLGLCSCIAFSLTALIVKSLPQYHSFALALWRFIGEIGRASCRERV